MADSGKIVCEATGSDGLDNGTKGGGQCNRWIEQAALKAGPDRGRGEWERIHNVRDKGERR